MSDSTMPCASKKTILWYSECGAFILERSPWGLSHHAIRSPNHMERPLVGTAVHGPWWAQPLNHASAGVWHGPCTWFQPPSHSSNPQMFESSERRSQASKKRESTPVCALSEFLTTDSVDTIKWLLLHPPKLGVTCCTAIIDNPGRFIREARRSKTLKSSFGSSWTNSMEMLESAFCHISHPSASLSLIFGWGTQCAHY